MTSLKPSVTLLAMAVVVCAWQMVEVWAFRSTWPVSPEPMCGASLSDHFQDLPFTVSTSTIGNVCVILSLRMLPQEYSRYSSLWIQATRSGGNSRVWVEGAEVLAWNAEYPVDSHRRSTKDTDNGVLIGNTEVCGLRPGYRYRVLTSIMGRRMSPRDASVDKWADVGVCALDVETTAISSILLNSSFEFTKAVSYEDDAAPLSWSPINSDAASTHFRQIDDHSASGPPISNPLVVDKAAKQCFSAPCYIPHRSRASSTSRRRLKREVRSGVEGSRFGIICASTPVAGIAQLWHNSKNDASVVGFGLSACIYKIGQLITNVGVFVDVYLSDGTFIKDVTLSFHRESIVKTSLYHDNLDFSQQWSCGSQRFALPSSDSSLYISSLFLYVASVGEKGVFHVDVVDAWLVYANDISAGSKQVLIPKHIITGSIPNFVESSVSIVRSDVTLVTHLSMSQLNKLFLIKERWGGPISVAILWMNQQCIEISLSKVKSILEGAKGFENVDFHVVCVTSNIGHLSKKYHHDSVYPMNNVRNVALKHVKTDFIFLLDIENIMCENTYPKLKQRFTNPLPNLASVFSTVFIVPAFKLVIRGNDVRKQSMIRESPAIRDDGSLVKPTSNVHETNDDDIFYEDLEVSNGRQLLSATRKLLPSSNLELLNIIPKSRLRLLDIYNKRLDGMYAAPLYADDRHTNINACTNVNIENEFATLTIGTTYQPFYQAFIAGHKDTISHYDERFSFFNHASLLYESYFALNHFRVLPSIFTVRLPWNDTLIQYQNMTRQYLDWTSFSNELKQKYDIKNNEKDIRLPLLNNTTDSILKACFHININLDQQSNKVITIHNSKAILPESYDKNGYFLTVLRFVDKNLSINIIFKQFFTTGTSESDSNSLADLLLSEKLKYGDVCILLCESNCNGAVTSKLIRAFKSRLGLASPLVNNKHIILSVASNLVAENGNYFFSNWGVLFFGNEMTINTFILCIDENAQTFKYIDSWHSILSKKLPVIADIRYVDSSSSISNIAEVLDITTTETTILDVSLLSLLCCAIIIFAGMYKYHRGVINKRRIYQLNKSCSVYDDDKIV